jgi:hypothetical protein
MLGCTPAEDVQPVDIQTIERAEVTFDGESCSYDGPEVIHEGVVTIAINNSTENPAHLEINTLDEGKTWQDVLDYYGEPGSTEGRAPWMGDVDSSPIISEPEAREYTFEPGLHSVLSLVIFETGAAIYPCTPLDVRAAP